LPEARLKSCPLEQVVTATTPGKSILDKIFTSVLTWYQALAALSAVTCSDNETILFRPEEDPPRPAKLVKIAYRRVNSHNWRASLFDHLQRHSWSHFYHYELLPGDD